MSAAENARCGRLVKNTSETMPERVVFPLSVVDNLAFSPNGLTTLLGLLILPMKELSTLFTSFGEDCMAFHVFLFLIVVCLLLSLTLLCRLCWLHRQPSHSKVQRLLKPRTPLDCPACRLSCDNLSGVGLAPAPVRPWREVKSCRGAPKRVKTEGFACQNPQCPYVGITDAHIHALVGDGEHGHAERIQTFRCQACHTTFTARRHTPLYRLKTPSYQIAMVLTALAEGLDASAAERVFGYQQSTITTWLSRAGEHAQTLHKHFFCNLHLPHVQLDELRTRLRSCTQVLWLWLAIDPCTKLLPVLYLGPRTQNAAHVLIHSLPHGIRNE
jgi:transposase-like protein